MKRKLILDRNSRLEYMPVSESEKDLQRALRESAPCSRRKPEGLFPMDGLSQYFARKCKKGDKETVEGNDVQGEEQYMMKKRTFGRNDKLIYGWAIVGKNRPNCKENRHLVVLQGLKDPYHDYFRVDELAQFIHSIKTGKKEQEKKKDED